LALDAVVAVVPVAPLLAIPEASAVPLLDELEEAGCVASTTGPLQ